MTDGTIGGQLAIMGPPSDMGEPHNKKISSAGKDPRERKSVVVPTVLREGGRVGELAQEKKVASVATEGFVYWETKRRASGTFARTK